jgi:hypothetical protein
MFLDTRNFSLFSGLQDTHHIRFALTLGLRALLKRMAETLTFKSVKVKALGVEADLTPEYARTVLHSLLDDITASTLIES